MKYTRWIPALILAVLTLTATALASDVHSVTVDGDHVSVTFTADADAALYMVLFRADGKMLDMETGNVVASTKQQTANIDLRVSVPADGYVRASLLDRETCAPLCGSADSRGPEEEPFVPDTDVYAILYTDGELVFQHGDTPEAGRLFIAKYKVNLRGGYVYASVPWYRDRESITSARFADTISPVSTAWWFYECSALTELDLSYLDTSHVTSMWMMFSGCSALTELDLSHFDTSHVTDMGSMFSRCSALTELDLSHFDTSHVTNMREPFYGCSALTELDLSHFDTSHVTNMWGMFEGCSALTELDLSHFDTSHVTDMMRMFRGCSGLTTIFASERFVTSAVASSDLMFSSCTSLVGGAGTVRDGAHTDVSYARIDGGPSAPGYFTLKES